MEENEDAIAEALAKDMHKVWPLQNTVNPLLSTPPLKYAPPFSGEES